MATVEAIVTAWMPIPDAYVFPGGGPRVRQVAELVVRSRRTTRCPCLAFVVRHPSEGVLLIDTGFHPDAAADRRKDFGGPMSLMFRTLEPTGSFDQQLRDCGVEPDEVARVVMTHLHVDHTSGMRLLPNATFVCDRLEWQAATGSRAAMKGYVAGHLPPVQRMELIDFAAAEPHGPFARSVDLFGDGSVRLLSTPGHTAGHISVLVQLDGGGAVLILGDAAYTRRSVDEAIVPLLTADSDAYRRSVAEVAEFTRERSDALVVPTHDPDAWRALETRTPAAAAS